MAGTRDALDSLAPWDAIPYFREITEVAVNVPATTVTLVIPADPNRVGLVVSASAVGVALISLNPATNGTSGIPVGNTIPPLQLRFAESGPLCQKAWYCYNMGQLTITYYPIVLSKWPRADGARKGGRRAPTS